MNEENKRHEMERAPVFIPCGDAFEKMAPESYAVPPAEEGPVPAADGNQE